MKKTILLLACMAAASSALAQTADQLKQQSMQACDLQANSVPEAQREMVLSVCKCTVENTDYALMMSIQGDAQKMQEAQAASMKVAQECTTKASG